VPIGALRNRGSGAEIGPVSLLQIAFKVRQRRADSAVRGGSDSPAHAKMRLIAQQFAPSLFRSD
jgi:hypothetical protein